MRQVYAQPKVIGERCNNAPVIDVFGSLLAARANQRPLTYSVTKELAEKTGLFYYGYGNWFASTDAMIIKAEISTELPHEELYQPALGQTKPKPALRLTIKRGKKIVTVNLTQ